MSIHPVPSLLLACSLAGPAMAQQTVPRAGDHPAVVAQRLRLQQGYDFAAQFYPHPAWLYLVSEAPPATPRTTTVVADANRPATGDRHERTH